MNKAIENESVEARGNNHVEMMYPEIYDRAKQNWLQVGLCHTRASDDIRIKFDADRNGWVIEQASIFEWDADDKEQNEDWQAVAFVSAWGRDPQQT